MDKTLIDEFVLYAKEKFGVKIVPKENKDSPDTFEQYFGMSFIKEELYFSYFPMAEINDIEYDNIQALDNTLIQHMDVVENKDFVVELKNSTAYYEAA